MREIFSCLNLYEALSKMRSKEKEWSLKASRKQSLQETRLPRMVRLLLNDLSDGSGRDGWIDKVRVVEVCVTVRSVQVESRSWHS